MCLYYLCNAQQQSDQLVGIFDLKQETDNQNQTIHHTFLIYSNFCIKNYNSRKLSNLWQCLKVIVSQTKSAKWAKAPHRHPDGQTNIHDFTQNAP